MFEKINKDIKLLSYPTLKAKKYKAALKEVFSNSASIDELKESYLQRLQVVTESESKVKKIIVCGFIAQAFLEYALDLPDLAFGKAVKQNVLGKEVSIFYTEHPSPKNDNTSWTADTVKNKALRLFAECS